jgi:hypothetical protein
MRGPTCGVTIVTRRTTTRLIEEQSPNLNNRKRLALKSNLNPERSLWPSLFFLKKLTHLIGIGSLKRLQAVRRERLNPSSLLSTEINLTTRSDESENRQYLFNSSKPFRSSETKLEKSSHPFNKN